MLSADILTEVDTVQNLGKKRGEVQSGVLNNLSLTLLEYENSSKKSLLRIYLCQIFHPLQSFSSHVLLCYS